MKKNRSITILISLLIPISLLVWKVIFKNDFIFLFKLWFTLLIIGLLFYPTTLTIFKKFNDKGWIFSKVIGLTISSWFMWILSYLQLFKYTRFNSLFIVFILAIINIILFVRKKKKTGFKFNNQNIFNEKNIKCIKNIIITELLFMLFFTFWTYIKGYNPTIDELTEQFMDYGYINSIMNLDYMPPEDMWLSGKSINYYYYGHYALGFICKLADIHIKNGYNICNAFIASLTFIMPYSIGYNLLNIRFKNKEKKIHKIIPILLAIIIGTSVSFGGTLHYPIYKWILRSDDYTFIDQTRYIGYKPEVNDKAVTEVPAYSSMVGDLHPHYIDLIFSFTAIALLLQYFLTIKKKKYPIFDLNIILIAFILGIQRMTNYWDFPIYLVIISSIIISKKIICGKFTKKNVLQTALTLFEIIIIEELTTLLFTLDLYVGISQIHFTGITSPFYKLAVLWALQTICVILFLIFFLYKYKKPFKKHLITHLNDFFVVIIGLCALGLVILPEIIYLKDIYGNEFKRFNTMFKLTYQAYFLLCITTNYIIFKFIISSKKTIKFLGIILLIFSISTLNYGFDAMNYAYKNSEHLSILETEKVIRETLPADYNAIQWINNNISKDKVILESTSYGNSYSYSSRVSVFTGNPTVLGWIYHEWIWRSNKDYSIPQELITRNDDIYYLYTAQDVKTAREIINKYNISYIYIGYLEMETYENINITLLSNLGEIVYVPENFGSGNIFPIIIEVK